MRVLDALKLASLCGACEVLPGEQTREVMLAHVVDVPEAPRWVTPGTFLLSTSLSWSRDPAALRALCEDLAACEPAAAGSPSRGGTRPTRRPSRAPWHVPAPARAT